mgnify:CR=1 FL=1
MFVPKGNPCLLENGQLLLLMIRCSALPPLVHISLLLHLGARTVATKPSGLLPPFPSTLLTVYKIHSFFIPWPLDANHRNQRCQDRQRGQKQRHPGMCHTPNMHVPSSFLSAFSNNSLKGFSSSIPASWLSVVLPSFPMGSYFAAHLAKTVGSRSRAKFSTI